MVNASSTNVDLPRTATSARELVEIAERIIRQENGGRVPAPFIIGQRLTRWGAWGDADPRLAEAAKLLVEREPVSPEIAPKAITSKAIKSNAVALDGSSWPNGISPARPWRGGDGLEPGTYSETQAKGSPEGDPKDAVVLDRVATLKQVINRSFSGISEAAANDPIDLDAYLTDPLAADLDFFCVEVFIRENWDLRNRRNLAVWMRYVREVQRRNRARSSDPDLMQVADLFRTIMRGWLMQERHRLPADLQLIRYSLTVADAFHDAALRDLDRMREVARECADALAATDPGIAGAMLLLDVSRVHRLHAFGLGLAHESDRMLPVDIWRARTGMRITGEISKVMQPVVGAARFLKTIRDPQGFLSPITQFKADRAREKGEKRFEKNFERVTNYMFTGGLRAAGVERPQLRYSLVERDIATAGPFDGFWRALSDSFDLCLASDRCKPRQHVSCDRCGVPLWDRCRSDTKHCAECRRRPRRK